MNILMVTCISDSTRMVRRKASEKCGILMIIITKVTSIMIDLKAKAG